MADKHTVDTGSLTTTDDLSVAHCERLVLSPPPVPMNLDEACTAIDEASRRSISRTHSLNTSHLDGCGDAIGQPSESELSKLNMERIPSTRVNDARRPPSRPRRGWFRLLFCGCSSMLKPKSNRSPSASQLAPDGINDHQKNGEPVLSTPIHKVPPSHPLPTSSPSNKISHSKYWWPKKSLKQPSHPNHTSVDDQGIVKNDLVDGSRGSSLTNSAALPNSVLDALSSEKSTRTSVPLHKSTYPTTSTTGALPLSSLNQTQFQSSTPGVIPSVPPVARSSPSVPTLPRLSWSTRPKTGSAIDADSSSTQPTWVGGDGTISATSVPKHEEEDIYDTDQNGARGDSASDLMEPMSPGMDLLGDLPPNCVNKKCLVIDLDETLVHSWFKYVDNASFVVPVDLEGIQHQIYVCKRPYLDEFMHAVCPLFECVMFTASLRKYADPVCDHIDNDARYFHHRLFRESCVYHQNNYVKDLSRLGRDVDQICILDNSPVSFLFQPANALQIVSWFDDPHDTALLDLIPYLQGLARCETVTDYLRDYKPPDTAALAQPETPPWLMLLCYPNLSIESEEGEPDDDEPDDGVDEDYAPEEDVVLSPHFHPPVGLPRFYRQTVKNEIASANRTPLPVPTSFIHQAAWPGSQRPNPSMPGGQQIPSTGLQTTADHSPS